MTHVELISVFYYTCCYTLFLGDKLLWTSRRPCLLKLVSDRQRDCQTSNNTTTAAQQQQRAGGCSRAAHRARQDDGVHERQSWRFVVAAVAMQSTVDCVAAPLKPHHKSSVILSQHTAVSSDTLLVRGAAMFLVTTDRVLFKGSR